MSVTADEYNRALSQAKHARNQAVEDDSKHAIMTRCKQLGLPEPVAEYRFARPRQWRFDLCWLPEKLALEFEGGIHTNGRHTRGAGYERDLEKYNQAALLGWRVIRVTHEQVRTDEAIQLVETALRGSE